MIPLELDKHETLENILMFSNFYRKKNNALRYALNNVL